jgi:hypothetical protein
VTGQADTAPETGDLSDLASFLSDTPEEESTEEIEALADDSTDETADTEPEANDEQDIDPEAPDEGEDADEPAPVEKITFKVKGEDGKEEVIEATPEDLASSYLRQKDYTKKTQALAEREDQAVKFLTQKHDELRTQYLTQAEVARAAVSQMAGLKSESEMAQLANSDPAAWVAENQRQRQVMAFLNQLDSQIQGEKTQAQTEAAQREQQTKAKMYENAWNELSKDGIDKPKLQKIYSEASKSYGFTDDELGGVYDPRMVRVLRDAAAYRNLQAQKAVVTKKVQAAPRMPQRQASPAQERRDQAIENKFKSGRAKLNDLAAFLA